MHHYVPTVLGNIKILQKYILISNKVLPIVYLSKSLPIDERDVCCGLLCTFDDGVAFFNLAVAASLSVNQSINQSETKISVWSSNKTKILFVPQITNF